MQITYRETTLPVLREADFAIVGGSLAGIAAALRLAREGQTVILIEPRTYLGGDITATLRPWLQTGDVTDPNRLPKPIRTILNAHDVPVTQQGSEIPLHPDTVKRSLEDALMAANVGLLYASLPTGLCEGGLVIGNKSGRQIIRCRTIIDATETAVVARLAGGTFGPPPEGPVRMTRTLEFDRIEPIPGTSIPVPERLGIADDLVRLHTGYRGAGHLLIECPMDLPSPTDLEGADYVEVEARRRTMHLAAFLMDQYPGLAAGRLAGSSHELHGRWAASLAGPPPDWAGYASDAMVSFADDAPTASTSISRFAGPVPGLWCLSEAARLGANEAGSFLDPARAARLGERFATALASIQDDSAVMTGAIAATARAAGDSVNGAVVSLDVHEPGSPQRGRSYEWQPVPSSTLPVHRTIDVLVVGGGSSGATAAITAARKGMRTVLLDMNPGPGGTGTYGGVDSYWYGRHVGFAARLEQEVEAQQACIRHTGGKWNIDVKAWVLREMANDAGVECRFNAFAIAALIDHTEGNRVRGAVVATRWGVVAVLAEVVIDATGDGDLGHPRRAPGVSHGRKTGPLQTHVHDEAIAHVVPRES